MLTRALIISRGSSIGAWALAGVEGEEGDAGDILLDVERQRIASVLEATGWHRGKACEVLGITRPTLRRKMSEFNLERVRSGRTMRD